MHTCTNQENGIGARNQEGQIDRQKDPRDNLVSPSTRI